MSDIDSTDQLTTQTVHAIATHQRVRTLTKKGMELYETERQKHLNILQTIWESVESHIDISIGLTENPLDLRQHKSELERHYEHYTVVSQKFVEFLQRTNIPESIRELDCHTSLSRTRDQLVKNALKQLTNQITDIASHKSKTSNASKVSSILARKTAEAAAARTKSDFAKKEAELKKKQAAVMEKQQLIAIQNTRLQTELAELTADLECLKSEGHAAETAAEVTVLQSFVASNESDNLSQISVPVEKSMERTAKYVQQCSQLDTSSGSEKLLDNKNIQQACVGRVLFDSTDDLGTPRPTVHFQADNSVFDYKTEVSSVSGNMDTRNVQSPTVLNPDASEYYPSYNPVYMRRTSPIAGASNVTHEITNFLLRKELLLTRLHSFNDAAENYVSWKSGFKCVINEIGVTDMEELDLLIRWLGPTSTKHAQSLKSANPYNPSRALRLIWQRLDERFGAPEMIEAVVKAKIEQFPKLTNKDNKKLYELVDILMEIDSLKQNEPFKTHLAYYDSSSGTLPIVRKLPYNLQEKWISRAADYKEKHNSLFPPFSFFVKYIQDMSKIRNDPSFAYDPIGDIPSRKTNCSTNVQNNRMNISTKKTEMSLPPKTDEQTVKKCPLHKSAHSLDECRGFKSKSLKERYDILKEHRICFRCCSSTTHGSKNCQKPISCSECKSNQHTTALHVHKASANPTSTSTSAQSIIGGEVTLPAVNSNCTKVCGKRFPGKSCSKNILVTVYPSGQPQRARRVYAIFDEQSNVSLARTEFFEMFDEHGDSTPFTLASCNGRIETTGRRARNYILSSIDGCRQLSISQLVECDTIPDMREEIPTPQVALSYPHLNPIVNSIPPVDIDANILLLIGRDNPEAHHVLQQLTGPQNTPYAQLLPLGWVIVGETCLGKTHRPDFNVNKINFLKGGQPSHFTPCDRQINVKMNSNLCVNKDCDLTSDVFQTTVNDNKRGTSIEDRIFLQMMDERFRRLPDGNWTAPLPFRSPRPRLPDNRSQAVKRAKTLHNSLVNNPVKREHFFAFMGKILNDNHAELAPSLDLQAERWYLPPFGVYHPHKPNQIRGVFDSSAQHNGLSLNDILLKGPDLTNSLLGILLRFRREPIGVTADVERMFYCFRVDEEHRDYLRFLWYRDNKFENELVEYRMTVHVFRNSPSPAIATYGLRKAAQAGIDYAYEDVVSFVDDALRSLPTANEAIDLLKKSQHALDKGGNIRLHKIASNNQDVINAFPSIDQAKDIKDLDLGSDSIPLQRSLGLAWDLKADAITFQIDHRQKPFTRRGVLSTINSLFDPIGFVAPIVIRGKMLLRELMADITDWDEPLPEHRQQEWDQWKSTLQSVQNLHIPRSYGCLPKKNITIYCDASQKAIAAVAYMNPTDDASTSQTTFILGKAKLAPLHGHTIPRLELCTTVLAIEIEETIAEYLKLPLDSQEQTKRFANALFV